MRFCFVVLAGVCLLAQSSCVRRTPEVSFAQLTGTCEGACEYYLACKQVAGDEVKPAAQNACEVECSDVFASEEAILAFESLVCEDIVAFVEGPSGRAPGEPLVKGTSQPAKNASMRSAN